jgi:MarR family transcriptional regulator, negative regulator of the multidrug operon emrRAB
MSHTRDANLLGAVSLAVLDRMGEATRAASGHGGSAPAALAALTTYLEGSSIDALARALGLSHSAAVRLVDRLEGAGLVRRERGGDGRSVAIGVTDAGRTTGRAVLAERERALDGVLDVLDDRERAELARLHERLLGGLTTGRAAARTICRMCDPHGCGHYDGRCPVTLAADRAEAAA